MTEIRQFTPDEAAEYQVLHPEAELTTLVDALVKVLKLKDGE